jgi:SAM-dependent methyltransferase
VRVLVERFHGTDSGSESELGVLKQLWARQVEHAAATGAGGPGMDYLASHFAMDITLERHLRVVDAMIPYIRGRVLEWGCRHALDSCVYRMRLGDRVELFGCDVSEPGEYRPFHEFSGLAYQQIRHPYRLDYDDDAFDVVTSNGVLEHVPDDAASVAEMFRVLRPGGVFVIACLPNKYSYTEALQRRRGVTAHDRLYTVSGTRRLLRERGFEVGGVRRMFMVPTMLHGAPEAIRRRYQNARRLVWAADAVLARAWPLNLLASNLMLVATKPPAPAGAGGLRTDG